MTFGFAQRKPLHLDPVDPFVGFQVADFEAEQTVYVYEYQGLGPVQGERSNRVTKGANGLLDGVVLGVRNR